ncbi:putative eukaryotic initiation factor-3, subunit 3 [Toxoplasma gondii ARI]|uniref:Eukaryotic translation initiation factor 3 subunit H n=1 Tax=Toxoplasma gondii ARI TaxID=1074872 RepID=A0A139XNK0_TOXGO|nr:putative eukaryotic initiation factor-3, subunit 3 [Toxoplasma gondii ARI]
MVESDEETRGAPKCFSSVLAHIGLLSLSRLAVFSLLVLAASRLLLLALSRVKTGSLAACYSSSSCVCSAGCFSFSFSRRFSLFRFVLSRASGVSPVLLSPAFPLPSSVSSSRARFLCTLLLVLSPHGLHSLSPLPFSGLTAVLLFSKPQAKLPAFFLCKMNSGGKYIPPSMRGAAQATQAPPGASASAPGPASPYGAAGPALSASPVSSQPGVSPDEVSPQGVSPHQRRTAAQVLAGVSAGARRAKASYPLRVVEVDSLVLMKVLKHCKENYPTPVNGQLLGIDCRDRLEVTNCFPLPQKKDIMAQVQREKGISEKDLEERIDEEFDKYQDKMAELMHDVNVDCFTVGWYQTLSFGDLKNKDIIDSLVLYQEAIDKAIVLGFDPMLNSMAKKAFKAYRVNPEFVQKYHEFEQDVSKYSKLRAKDILIEVPLVVVNPFLVEAFLMDWAVHDPLQNQADFDSLELDQSVYMEKNLSMLSLSLEALGDEQDKLQRYQRESLKQQQLQKQLLERRRLENDQRRLRGEPLLPADLDGPAFRKIDPPSQLNTLMMSSQAQLQCEEINAACSETLGKMFLLHWGNLRKKQTPAGLSAAVAAAAADAK